MNIFTVLGWEEGYSKKPFIDSLGYPTIGHGTRIGPKGADLSMYQIEFSKKVAAAYMEEDVSDLLDELANRFNWYTQLTFDKQLVICSMAYQLGVNGLAKFRKMILAIEREDWASVRVEALDSNWFDQTPERAMRHAKVLGGEPIKIVYKDFM